MEHASVFPILFSRFHPSNLFSCSLIMEHEVCIPFLGLGIAYLSLPQGVLPFQGLAKAGALIVLGNSASNLGSCFSQEALDSST